MNFPTLATRNTVSLARALVLLAVAATLAGCETDSPAAQAAKPPEPPMTRTRAAGECWMATEKGYNGMNLDKRADVVTKCIDDKMKAAKAVPKT